MDGWTHEQKINDLELRLARATNALVQIANLGSEEAASRYGSESAALIAAIEIAEQALKE